MGQRNFSVGDVVVCVDNDGLPELSLRALYTVINAGDWFDTATGDCLPSVELAEVRPLDQGEGFASECFAFAYRPDPEVEREATREPSKPKVDA